MSLAFTFRESSLLLYSFVETLKDIQKFDLKSEGYTVLGLLL